MALPENGLLVRVAHRGSPRHRSCTTQPEFSDMLNVIAPIPVRTRVRSAAAALLLGLAATRSAHAQRMVMASQPKAPPIRITVNEDRSTREVVFTMGPLDLPAAGRGS